MKRWISAVCAAAAALAVAAAYFAAPDLAPIATSGMGPKWTVCGLGAGLVAGGILWSGVSPGGGLLAFGAGYLLMSVGCN